MPIYEYQCLNCGHQTENLQNINEKPLIHCAECGKDTLKKKISAAGFQLKGTGWYETDFKDKPAAKKDPAVSSEKTPEQTKPITEGKKEK